MYGDYTEKRCVLSFLFIMHDTPPLWRTRLMKMEERNYFLSKQSNDLRNVTIPPLFSHKRYFHRPQKLPGWKNNHSRTQRNGNVFMNSYRYSDRVIVAS